MFELRCSSDFWWPVQVRHPDEGWKSQVLEVQFRHFKTDEYEAFMQEVARDKLRDPHVCARVVLNWRKVVTPAKEPVPFSAEALAQLCLQPGAASSIVRDFIDAHTRAHEKN